MLSRWQRPGTVVNFEAPHTYLVELERGQHANKLRPYNVRVTTALVNNCAIVNQADEDFGTLTVVDTETKCDLPSNRVNPEKLVHLSETQK